MTQNIPNISQKTPGDKSLAARMPQVKGYVCTVCGRDYSLDETLYVCEDCGQVGTLDVVLNPAVILPGREHPNLPKANVWEEERFLPIAQDMPPPAETIPLKVGDTPYYPPNARHSYAIIDDGKNPTGSFKDRASAMVVHQALTISAPVVATASTGNAAAALAGICAAVGNIRAMIFVPASAPEAKIAQLLIYGAEVILVDGPYDDAFDLCWDACAEFGWYNRSTGINPFTSEGKKTIAWDIAFSGHPLPDAVVVSVGDGSIINGLYKGFTDLHALGWVARVPRLIGVQSTGSRALVDAWEQDLAPQDMTPQPAQTLADSISAALPRDRAKALRAVRETGGAYVAVPDEVILAAIPALARETGVFAEPAGAAAYAGWQTAREAGHLSPDEGVLLLNTGSGLKDIRGAMRAVQAAEPIPPTLAALQAALRERKIDI